MGRLRFRSRHGSRAPRDLEESRRPAEIETQPQECSDEREFTKASARIPVALARRESNKLGVPERKQKQSPLAEQQPHTDRWVDGARAETAEDGLACLPAHLATRGAEAGVPLRVMQKLLGHSSPAVIAKYYQHIGDQSLRMLSIKSLPHVRFRRSLESKWSLEWGKMT
jgi:hypothetical protein